MTEERTQAGAEASGASQPSPGEAWREVGEQFQALGLSLAAAFRAAWHSSENQQQLREVRDNLETVADKFRQTVKDATSSPEVHELRTEVEKVAHSARAAGQQTLEEARPQLLATLRQLRAEVDKMIGRLETENAAPDENRATSSGPDNPDQV